MNPNPYVCAGPDTFRVVAAGRSIAGDALYAVTHDLAGVPLGADHHWVRERYAVRACALYALRPDLHGAHPDVLAAAFLELFRVAMFDTDAAQDRDEIEQRAGLELEQVNA